MRKYKKLALVWLMLGLLACAIASAEDITTRDGKVYKDVTVIRVEPNGLAVTYRPEGGGIGMAKLKYRDLPEKLQCQYGYDEPKAAAFEASQASAQAALQVQMQADYADAKTRLAKRKAQEEAQWQADQAVKASLAAQQVARGGGSNVRQHPASGKPSGLPQDVINQIKQQAAERAAATGANATAIMLEALRNAGASSQQLQQAAAQRGVATQNRPAPAAPVKRN